MSPSGNVLSDEGWRESLLSNLVMFPVTLIHTVYVSVRFT